MKISNLARHEGSPQTKTIQIIVGDSGNHDFAARYLANELVQYMNRLGGININQDSQCPEIITVNTTDWEIK